MLRRSATNLTRGERGSGAYSPQRRSNKPWKALFIWTLDIACVNADYKYTNKMCLHKDCMVHQIWTKCVHHKFGASHNIKLQLYHTVCVCPFIIYANEACNLRTFEVHASSVKTCFSHELREKVHTKREKQQSSKIIDTQDVVDAVVCADADRLSVSYLIKRIIKSGTIFETAGQNFI
jgi:hypothetical protein